LPHLFHKDQNIQQSPPIVGYEIMRYMATKKRQRISIFDVAEQFQHEKWFSVDNLYLAVIFLYSVGLLEFHEPYLVLNVPA
jgi:hypothetical protein